MRITKEIRIAHSGLIFLSILYVVGHSFAFASGGGVGNGGNVVKLEFYRTALQISYYSALKRGAHGQSMGSEFFGSEFDEEKLTAAIQDSNIFVYLGPMRPDPFPTQVSARAKPILLDEASWMDRMIRDASFEMPVCLELANSMGVTDQPEVRCKNFLTAILSSRGRWVYSLLPSDVANGRLDAFLKINPLPPGCTLSSVPRGTGGRQANRVSDGRDSVDFFADRVLRREISESVSANGTVLRSLSIVSDDPEGNYDRKLKLVITYRKTDLVVTQIRGSEIVRRTAGARAAVHSVHCEQPVGVSINDDDLTIRTHFNRVFRQILPALLKESPLELLEKASRPENLAIEADTMTDRFGSLVHGKVESTSVVEGVVRRIFLSRPIWSFFIKHNRPLGHMVCHEIKRSLGLDDDQFKSCFHQLGVLQPNDLLIGDLKRLQYFLDPRGPLPGGCKLASPDSFSVSSPALAVLSLGSRQVTFDINRFRSVSIEEGEWRRSWFRHSKFGRREYLGQNRTVFQYEDPMSHLKLRLEILYSDSSFQPETSENWPYPIARPDSHVLERVVLSNASGSTLIDCR